MPQAAKYMHPSKRLQPLHRLRLGGHHFCSQRELPYGVDNAPKNPAVPTIESPACHNNSTHRGVDNGFARGRAAHNLIIVTPKQISLICMWVIMVGVQLITLLLWHPKLAPMICTGLCTVGAQLITLLLWYPQQASISLICTWVQWEYN